MEGKGGVKKSKREKCENVFFKEHKNVNEYEGSGAEQECEGGREIRNTDRDSAENADM